MWPNPQFPENLVTFTEEILNEKLHFLWSVTVLTDGTHWCVILCYHTDGVYMFNFSLTILYNYRSYNFSLIIQSKSPHFIPIWENTDQKISENGLFLCGAYFTFLRQCGVLEAVRSEAVRSLQKLYRTLRNC